MRIKPRSSTYSGPPRTVEEFRTLWGVPSEDELINGSDQLPDLNERQENLIRQAIDAGIILYVYERLRERASLAELEFLFTDKFSPEDIAVLQKDRKNDADDAEKLQLLIRLSRAKDGARLLNHSDMEDEQEREKYLNDMAVYKAQKEAYEIYIQSEADRITPLSEKPAAQEIAKLRPPPVEPVDPRIVRVNHFIRPIITLLNPGPKSPASIRDKIERKNKEIVELNDLNRIGVLPVEPQYAADYIRILTLLNAPRSIAGGSTIPRIFDELPEVFEHCYYNQKVFIAMDTARNAGEVTEGNMAPFAEIKIVPAAMYRAERLSAFIKPLKSKLDKPTQYTSAEQPRTEVAVTERKEALMHDYILRQCLFQAMVNGLNEESASEYGVESLHYKFPPFPRPSILNRRSTYDELSQRLEELRTQIHNDAIVHGNGPWQEIFLRTAIVQRLLHEKASIMDRIGNSDEKEHPRKDIVSPKWLKLIAAAGQWDFEALEKDEKKKIETKKLERKQETARSL